MSQIDATDARLKTHEEICAIHHETLNKRMTKIEYILYSLVAITLLGPGFAAELLKKMLLS